MTISTIVLINLNIMKIPIIAALTVPNPITPFYNFDAVFLAIAVRVFLSMIPRIDTVSGMIVFPFALLAIVFKTTVLSAENMT
jgi:hypothetical protein